MLIRTKKRDGWRMAATGLAMLLLPARAIAGWNGAEMRPALLIPAMLLALIPGLGAPAAALAHGAKLHHRVGTGIIIEAQYDSGQPMAQAPVIVYAPNDPARPWLTGQADELGRFAFVPDPEIAGTWSVQARQAGHGAMIHIPLHSPDRGAGEEAALSPPTAPASTIAQRWLMALAVVWGCIGTALFFLRRRP